MDAFPAYDHAALLDLPIRTFLALEAQAARLRGRRIADDARAVTIAFSKRPADHIDQLDRGGRG
jgi:hypothetical protein